MRCFLLALVCFLGWSNWADAQTTLFGKVTDEENAEPIILGNVVLSKNGVFATGIETDIDGNYSISNLDPGTYDVEVSYTGYQTKKVAGVIIYAGKANKLDIQLSAGVLLNEVVVVDYKVPLIEVDNTTQGATITSEQIRNLPTRNINALAATTAGLSSSDEGAAITVRGSRSDATNYYIDGIRVQGGLIPESEIDQLQVITGGVEAQYGDVTGGIISLTTKGPASKFSGGIEMETSEFLDAYRNSLIGINLSGPIIKKKSGESILGFRLSGRYTYNFDDNPPALSRYRVNDAKLAELEANPILELRGSQIPAADFVTNADVDVLDANPNEQSKRNDLVAKLDARLSKAMDISLSGSYFYSKNRFTPGNGLDNNITNGTNTWQLLNSHNNPYDNNNNYRGNFRFRHRLGSNSGDQNGNASIVQNAVYTLTLGYEKNVSDRSDSRHGDRYFDYGYVGKFDVEWVPTFNLEFNPDLQQPYFQHSDYRAVLRGYQPGAVNPVLANYNNVMGLAGGGEGLNTAVPDFILFNNSTALTATPDISREGFVAPNGFISGIFNNSWNFHTNVGWVYNNVAKGDNDIYTFNANFNFDLLPGGSEKGRHTIQLGALYEQRILRRYNVAPRNLWDVARQQANNHILGIPLEDPSKLDTIGFANIPGFGDAALYQLEISEGEDNSFYKRVREVTGQGLRDFVNVDGLDPSQLSLDMFSARELNDQGLIGYLGYDYLGNRFDGTFDEFFTARDADGIRTFPVAPARPIYFAGYLQDKFTFRDIIFRLGVRVDYYDANTRVLKDNYSLYEIMGADEYHGQFGGERPGNIGDEFKVYLNDAGTDIQAYRDGDQWYASNGTPVNTPASLFQGGLVNPKYKDDRVTDNFIKDPNFDPNVSFRDYEPQLNWMPRLSFSFPISTEANFFAHYDVLVQRPNTNTIASPLDYFYFADRSNFKNNPNLLPERTIDYEVGFQQKLSTTSALKISAYYKEMRSMIQARTFFPVPIVTQYNTYDNLDFGTVKGFSFNYDLRRTGIVSFNANYTLQFADGTGSDPNSQRGLTSRGVLRNPFPLSFDERHRLVGNLDIRFDSGNKYTGPRWGGIDWLADFGLNLQGIAVSGRPYTAKAAPLEFSGATTVGSINGARKPWTYTINLRVDKDVNFGNKLTGNVYVRISNVLDRRNVLNVYPATGSPTEDGFIQSFQGENQIRTIESSARIVQGYLNSYQWALLNPDFYSLPRRIFAGLIFDF